MKWLTWENVGVDRIASGWLIKKYVDPRAEFVFVKKGTGIKESEGIPFDIPGATLSHKRGQCTFCTLLKEYDIKDPVLDQLCDIIDAADSVNDLLPPPEAAGVDVIFRGLRKVLEDDYRALEVGFIIMDSLYQQLSEEY